MPHRHTRRRFLRDAALLSAVAMLPRTGRAQGNRTRLVLLGTGGGPTPKKAAAATSHAIVVGDTLYVVDCGNGVGRQLALANLPLLNLRHVFITHQHSDHNADYGNLVWLAWATGLGTRVDTWGPPPLARMTTLFLEMNAADIDVRVRDEGRPPLGPLVHPHEFSAGGPVMDDGNVKVTAALVEHPLVSPAFAYRFDGRDRSIVFSGDTTRSDRLIELARGADVLVHEAMWLPGIDRIVAREPNATTLRRHLLESHTIAEDCGRVAEAAGVKTLVLSHFVPGDGSVTDAQWRDAAKQHFRGNVVVGHDLMEI
ncbi:MAG TPA: MBL fold metallo-hydrolase [Vicinamibacterales bacterium]|nr:MBL fold metallo-hydrolase [Vicinamibacterales bacterium]